MADTETMDNGRYGETAYALKNDAIVHVSEVERGLACNCVCVDCGDRMVARKGEVRAHCFAHHAATDCSGGAETALHRKAKEILSQLSTFALPAVRLRGEARDRVAPETIEIASVALETPLGDIRPDARIETSDGRSVFVEIKVFSATSYQKRAIVEKDEHLMVEIALPISLGKDKLSALVDTIGPDTEAKRWIRHPAAKRAAAQAKSAGTKPTPGAGSKEACLLAIRDIDLSNRETAMIESRLDVFHRIHQRYPTPSELIWRIARLANRASDRQHAAHALERLTDTGNEVR